MKARWHLNKQATLQFGIAYLFSSGILEDAMLGAGYPSSKADNSTFLYTLGVNVKF